MSATPPWTPSDPIGEALHRLRMRGAFYCRNELTEPWALEIPAFADTVSFHVVAEGSCELHVPGEPRIALRRGDVVVVPHGTGHLLSAGAHGPADRVDLLPQRYLSEHYSVLTHGGGGSPARVLCSVVAFDEPGARELVRKLPPVLHIDAGTSPAPTSVHDTVSLMAVELADLRPGGEAVTTRLADVVVVQAIRHWLAHDPAARSGWLGALQDAHLGRALSAMHRDPGHPWTLEGLAREALMSRSTFAARFAEHVGESPMAYLTRWRMTVAHTRLREGRVGVSQLAAELGYGSDAAFSRAFTRVTGRTPGSVRRERAAVPAEA